MADRSEEGSDESQRVGGRLNGVSKADKPDRGQQLLDFQRACRERMAQGAIDYGDRSFGADPEDLLTEVLSELEDCANWSFILWCRVRDLSTRARE